MMKTMILGGALIIIWNCYCKDNERRVSYIFDCFYRHATTILTHFVPQNKSLDLNPIEKLGTLSLDQYTS